MCQMAGPAWHPIAHLRARVVQIDGSREAEILSVLRSRLAVLRRSERCNF